MSESERHAAAVAAADRIDDEVTNYDRLIDYVAAAMRAADGDHTMGTGQLAQVAVAAVHRFEDAAVVADA